MCACPYPPPSDSAVESDVTANSQSSDDSAPPRSLLVHIYPSDPAAESDAAAYSQSSDDSAHPHRTRGVALPSTTRGGMDMRNAQPDASIRYANVYGLSELIQRVVPVESSPILPEHRSPVEPSSASHSSVKRQAGLRTYLL